jgi:hypothetical protein
MQPRGQRTSNLLAVGVRHDPICFVVDDQRAN